MRIVAPFVILALVSHTPSCQNKTIGDANTGSVTLDNARLRHGDEQVEQMIRDRPPMGLHVVRGDAIWSWAARRFAGSGTGFLAWWNNQNPSFGEADHQLPTPSQDAYIRVARVPIQSRLDPTEVAESLWRAATFELLNLENASEFLRLYRLALKGRLDRAEWIERLR